jgi:hypothetical protein
VAAKRGTGPTTGGRKIYRLYGLNLASDFNFANRLAPGKPPPDLTFECVTVAPRRVDWEHLGPAYAAPPVDSDGESDLLLYALGDCWVLRFAHIADFYLWPDRIICHRRKHEYHRRLSQYPYATVEKHHHTMTEIYLLGITLSCWLELRDMATLHASAVEVDGRGVAFLSTGGGGKSTSAVAMMHAGFPLLTDDILAIEPSGDEFLGHPGYPQMRMWPDQAEHFLGRYEDLDLVHPVLSKRRVPVGNDGIGSFCGVSCPLETLYLPERRDPADGGTEIVITPVPRREAVMMLTGYSFVAPIVAALGLQPHRLRLFSRLTAEIPVRRVVYPSGYDYLPRLREKILDDIAETRGLLNGDRSRPRRSGQSLIRDVGQV